MGEPVPPRPHGVARVPADETNPRIGRRRPYATVCSGRTRAESGKAGQVGRMCPTNGGPQRRCVAALSMTEAAPPACRWSRSRGRAPRGEGRTSRPTCANRTQGGERTGWANLSYPEGADSVPSHPTSEHLGGPVSSPPKGAFLWLGLGVSRPDRGSEREHALTVRRTGAWQSGPRSASTGRQRPTRPPSGSPGGTRARRLARASPRGR